MRGEGTNVLVMSSARQRAIIIIKRNVCFFFYSKVSKSGVCIYLSSPRILSCLERRQELVFSDFQGS